ncbi:phosphoenolpyruvate synthase [Pseudalkalibacillus salsuginis]|uniref:phosphoenolpyruvate synthase n=1 Tax=Pseudalkalibacillus salsuginis TaxID=2910972 RepID=UPI001F37956E|nr:phosphoenolpyruvate synthase [Pseudalkalibacillus salsuginis]MCF6409763.1 phosphoenolpyruvate synthase [Pseudalkalibacillus salsuginis]
MEKYVLHFAEIDKTHLPNVGGKGANLGEMTKVGLPIPDGFCVSTSAYRTFIESSTEMEELFNQLVKVRADDLDEIRRLGQRIRNHLKSLTISDSIKSSIIEAWITIGQEKSYAVRSSATAEDLPNASFAGQQDTYLNIRGQEELLQAIQNCWASLFTDRAISYRTKNGFDHRSVFLSVVVQEMVNPDVSGIMFTADPITGHRETLSIDASFGLGEALVSGVVSADLYHVRESEIIKKQISEKKIAIFSKPEGGTVTEELPPDKQGEQALKDDEIIRLAEIGKAIEAHYGSEQDIEWCLVDGEFHIVQSRPITSLYPLPEKKDDRLHAYVSVSHAQMMTDVMKPLASSLWKTLFPFGKETVASECPYVQEIGGRIYIDLTNVLYLKESRILYTFLMKAMDEKMANALSNLVQRDEFMKDAQSNPAIKRGAIKLLSPVGTKVMKNVLFANPEKAAREADQTLDRFVKEAKEQLSGFSSTDRIRKIQDSVGTLFLSILPKLFPYFVSGMVANKLLRMLSNWWLGDDQDVKLLQKSLPGNVTSEMGLKVGDLADIVREHPELFKYLETAEDETFYQGMDRLNGGHAFREEFEDFMDNYGMRCSGEIDITKPRWHEAPTQLVPSILTHVRSVAPGQHRKKFKQGQLEADKAAERLIQRAKELSDGWWKARIIKRLVSVSRHLMGMREHHKYVLVHYMDQYRQALLEGGRRLVEENRLQQTEDMYYFSLHDLLSIMHGNFEGDIDSIIQERKEAYSHYAKLTPPRILTSDGESVTAVLSDIHAPEGALIGTPASAGNVEGIARVVLKPEESNLQEGEILIAPFTDPGWTPLFQSAKALVMEIGGTMTHGSVVAREYGIPAVVGIDGATQKIKNGQRIRVNAEEGYVQIIEGDHSE